ncbi:hypothetical protein J9303_14185 [Bacillaceae bacterium Marseille-Q3522]|nr:hypothetical protein [Bacillaceae bacterium Marseille-Q3522]
MKIVIGIAGPESSVRRIQRIGEKHFSEQLQLIPIIYQKMAELNELIPRSRAFDIDFWLFSGKMPYHYAITSQLVGKEEAQYPALAGSSLYRSLIKIIVHNRDKWSRISFDTMNENDIETALEDAELQVQFYSYPFKECAQADEVFQFHRNLYHSGKVDICLTCMKSVYRKLTDARIPCSILLPTQNLIKHTFPNIINKVRTITYQRSQVSIIAIEVDSKEWFSLRRKQTYEIKRREQKLEQYLVDFTERVRGSSVRIGDGLYFIFVTWGELMELEHSQELQSLPDQLQKLTNFFVHVGIGNGYTVQEAEINVRKALQYAHEKKEPSVMKVLQDGTVIGPLNKDENVSYATRHVLSSIENKLRMITGESSISLSAISKVYALSRHYKKDYVTAKELSRWLQVTDRSARRILKELHVLKLVNEVGEEQPGVRGRPRKVYHFQWSNPDHLEQQ